MRLGRQLRILLGVLVAIQVLTSLAGIGMLERMSPAIERIIEDNVASVRAVETMLGVLALPETGPRDAERFFSALEAAERNVTEPEERPLLGRIRDGGPATLAGDTTARRDVVSALQELGHINRGAMQAADEEAKRLGSAGRWALAFLALVGLVASVTAVRRARSRLLGPLAELLSVAAAYRAGDTHRRCASLPENELSSVLETVNDLLDRAERRAAPSEAGGGLPQALFVELLDRLDGPVLVIDDAGSLVAASGSALDILGERGDSILAGLREETHPEGVEEVVAVGDPPFRLVRLAP